MYLEFYESERSANMTSRERILAAINHKEPDYVPLDLGATPLYAFYKVTWPEIRSGVFSGFLTRPKSPSLITFTSS